MGVEHQREQHREQRQVAAAPEGEDVQEGRRGEQRQHQHQRVHARLLRVAGEERVDRAQGRADQPGAPAEQAPAGPHAARDGEQRDQRPTAPGSPPARRRRRPSRPRAACSRAAASRPPGARPGCRTAAARRSRSRAPRPSTATRRASWCAGRATPRAGPSSTARRQHEAVRQRPSARQGRKR